MKFTDPTLVLVLAAVTIAAPTPEEATADAALRNCSYGYNYWGSDLLYIGKYGSDIKNALSSKGQPTDADHILFILIQLQYSSDQR
ncbi:uncharacterized protein N0V89_008266 [Didymosphaeria variabile]|uniref:Uncharacterized protein n=1 Tax=Didymosphaeria variabile TaxID=1932322 RepID=A0A9W8XHA0_9PLEO|nr:uncharacterized protein N0V89_008266 [Didymosphaeria variabile]KAJ4349649.1 hypothetical protein N0V89_008266 [Didymosphaeria variabile]